MIKDTGRHGAGRGGRRQPGGGGRREPDPRAAQGRPGDGGRRASRALGGIPLIGFSNNSGAAQPGVYPAQRAARERSAGARMGYAKALGRQAPLPAIFPANTTMGSIQQSAFQQAARDLGRHRRGGLQFLRTRPRRAPSSRSSRRAAGRPDRRAVHARPRHRAELWRRCSSRRACRRAASWSSARPTGTTTRPSSTRPISSARSIPAVDDAGYQAHPAALHRNASAARRIRSSTHRLYRDDPRQRLGAVDGHAAIRRALLTLRRRLQRPRRRVPLSCRWPQPNMRW